MYDNIIPGSLFISAGEFDTLGGWVLDTQFIPNIGSSYLLAHGLGERVGDAVKKIRLECPGKYKIWVYTKNWTAKWKPNEAPGIFTLKAAGVTSCVLGNGTHEWAWQEAGVFDLPGGELEIALCDLSGFEGRCAAVFLSADLDFIPPDKPEDLTAFRSALRGYVAPEYAKDFDLVVAGGGIAGMCAAIAAARCGLEVALIHDRDVLGGNNSSEVRVWLGGETNFEPFPKIGDIVRMFEPDRQFHYGKDNTAEIYEDDKRLAILGGFPNIKMYLGCAVTGAVTDNGIIKSLEFIDVRTHRPMRISARLFLDSTGDAAPAHYAEADYEVTTNGHMGMTNVWHVADTGEHTEFPRCPWAIDLSDCKFPGRYAKSYDDAKKLGCWYWESGMEYDPIAFAEEARDTNLRAMYGAFDALKNVDGGIYDTYKLGSACYIGGKRESRRVLGDIILTKSEVLKNHTYPDACIPSTWKIDVHYPKKEYYPSFHEGSAFITTAYFEKFKQVPYFVPYRCLYSRNINNLFMAGRNVSVSHDALGTVRVMRTGGMMGEVVGFAAALCKKHGVLPRDIYERYLNEFMDILKRGSI